MKILREILSLMDKAFKLSHYPLGQGLYGEKLKYETENFSNDELKIKIA